MLHDHTVGNGKPQACSHADPLGCEAWVKDPLQVLLRNPLAIIRDLNDGKTVLTIGPDVDWNGPQKRD